MEPGPGSVHLEVHLKVHSGWDAPAGACTPPALGIWGASDPDCPPFTFVVRVVGNARLLALVWRGRGPDLSPVAGVG